MTVATKQTERAHRSEMPPKCEVATLAELALYSCVSQVTQALSDDEGAHHDTVSEYHRYTPPEILEDMLRDILSNEFLDAGTRFSCLQVLLRENVRRLDTGMFPTSYYEPIVQVVRLQGTGLQYLNLKGVWLKDNPRLLCDTLGKLSQLRALHIPHLVDDTVLHSFTKCTQLTVLDISGECTFTPEALSEWCSWLRVTKSQLQVVDIGSWGKENKPHENIAELIESLPNLISLRSYSFVGKSLQCIRCRHPNFRTKLKYIHDTGTTPQIFEAVLKLCPELEDLYLDSPGEDVLHRIHQCEQLTSLKLTRFQCTELQELLSNWPNRLHTLKLNLGRGIFDFSALTACPDLTTLELYKMDFLTHTHEEPLDRLETLEVTYTQVPCASLRYLLAAPRLQKLVLGEPVKLTDGDLYRLCARRHLSQLRELWFASARYLTANAVNLLMGQCEQLRVLGQLTAWNVTADDFDLLHAVIQSTNADLTLLPPTWFP